MLIIAHHDDGWLDWDTDRGQWYHLCRAYGVDFQLVRDWSEAKPSGRVYLVDESGETPLHEHNVDPDGTYVFGRTHLDLFKAGVPHHGSVYIDTPNPVSMFGVSAASIVLARWADQWR